MGEVVKLYTAKSDENPDSVLEQCLGEYNDVFVIGFDKDDILDFRATTTLSKERILWMLEQFKYKLMRGDYDA